MRKLLAIALLWAIPMWGQFGMNVPLRTNVGGDLCPLTATGPQPASIRGSVIATSVSSYCVTGFFPAGAAVGDFAVIFYAGQVTPTPADPSGWTAIYRTASAETNWPGYAAYKTLTSGDISGGVTVCQTYSPFDNHLGIVDFVGGVGSVREFEAAYSSGNFTITNTTTSNVVSTDVGLYWASGRQDGPMPPRLITITPDSGYAPILHQVTTTDACSGLSAQQMPGGVTNVSNAFGTGEGFGNGTIAIQVIVENP